MTWYLLMEHAHGYFPLKCEVVEIDSCISSRASFGAGSSHCHCPAGVGGMSGQLWRGDSSLTEPSLCPLITDHSLTVHKQAVVDMLVKYVNASFVYRSMREAIHWPLYGDGVPGWGDCLHSTGIDHQGYEWLDRLLLFAPRSLQSLDVGVASQVCLMRPNDASKRLACEVFDRRWGKIHFLWFPCHLFIPLRCGGRHVIQAENLTQVVLSMI